jgi:hypothetical protein
MGSPNVTLAHAVRGCIRVGSAFFPAGWTALWGAVLLGGCTQDIYLSHTREYFEDALNCRRQNLGPDDLATDAIPAIDTGAYLRCLQKLGYQNDTKTDPLLQALKKCQATATREVKAASISGDAKPRLLFDRGKFGACLKQRGVDDSRLTEAAQDEKSN